MAERRFIDANNLIEEIREERCYNCRNFKDMKCDYCGTADYIYMIEDMPAADVAPVVHAHWQPYEDTVQCSACGFGTFMDGYFFVHGECTHANDRSFRFSFCPNCGGKMDGDMNE